MYANKIRLVVTSLGVGVRNAGEIVGVNAGEVLISANGEIQNSGLINAQHTQLKADSLNNQSSGQIQGGQLNIDVHNLSNAGEIVGINDAQLAINVSGAIQNSGLIGGQSLQLKSDRLTNLLAGRIHVPASVFLSFITGRE